MDEQQTGLKFYCMVKCRRARAGASTAAPTAPPAAPSAGVSAPGPSLPAGSGSASAAAAEPGRDVLNRVLKTCAAAGVAVTHTVHEPVLTSAAAAAVRGVSLDSGAKAMALTVKGTPVLLVMSASQRVDWKRVRKLLSKAAKVMPADQLPVVTGCLTGAVPPFGSLLHTPAATYVDPSLRLQGPTINFNAGLRTDSISMTYDDFVAIERPTEAELCA